MQENPWNFTEEELASMRKALMEGATMADVLNMGKDSLEAGYALAYNLYTAGNYHDAETMFQALCLYDQSDERFWTGLAGCRQSRDDFAGAVDAYGMAALASRLGDPLPVYHAALCYLKQGDPENASLCLKAALHMGNVENPAHRECREKSAALLQAANDILHKSKE